MAAFSSTRVTAFRVVFLFALSFLCVKNVNIMLENPMLVSFSHSMNLPQLVINENSAQLGVFSLLFFLQGLHDLIPLLEKNHTFFLSVVPTRLAIFFLVTFISYVNQENLFIHNNIVFTYGFLEIWMNFLIFTALREERNTRFEDANKILAESYYADGGEPDHGDDEDDEEVNNKEPKQKN